MRSNYLYCALGLSRQILELGATDTGDQCKETVDKRRSMIRRWPMQTKTPREQRTEKGKRTLG